MSLVLKYIDTYYWDDKDVEPPYSDYFATEIKKWIEVNKSIFFSDRKRKEQVRNNIWSATYTLVNNTVILTIPSFLLNKDYDPYQVLVNIFEGDTLIKTIDKPEIKHVLGGYQLSEIRFPIKNPLQNIRYEIVAGDTIVYTSKDSLYRNYLIFNENNNEIKPGHKYIGNVEVVLKNSSKCDSIEIYHRNDFYKIGSRFIDQYDFFNIDDEIIYFTTNEKNQIQGNIYEDVYIKAKNRLYSLYKEVNDFVFISDVSPEKLRLQINQYNYHIKNYEIKKVNDKYICSIKISELIKDGFNYIKVVNIELNQTIFDELIFLDNSFNCNYRIDDENNIIIELNSSICNYNEYLCDLENENPFEIKFNSEYFEFPLFFIPNIQVPIYKIDDKSWKLFSVPISIKDIDSYSKIYVSGISFDSVKLIDSNEKYDINTKTISGKQVITVEKIRQFIEGKSKMTLTFFENHIAKESIDIYYKIVIDMRTFNVKYDEEVNQFLLNFEYFGKDDMQIMLREDDDIIFEATVTENPVKLLLYNIEFFKEYKLTILCGKDDLFSLDSNKYLIMNKDVTFYSSKLLIGQRFYIRKCWGEYFVKSKNEWQDKVIKFKEDTSQIIVKEMIEEDVFKVDIYVDSPYGNSTLEAKLELTSDINKGRFWGTLTSEGDLLLYSNKYSMILLDESFGDKNDMPISEYRFTFKAKE